MQSDKNKDENVKTTTKYVDLTEDEYNKRAQALLNLWEEFLKMHGEENTEYHVHEYNLYEVITRHDKRKYYYEIFHELPNPCEYKYIAIECFWINTLKPFMITNPKSAIYICPNEMFSLFLIIATIRGIFENVNPNKKFKHLSEDRMRDIIYDFKYCNMNREAMISFVETLADIYGIGIEYIMKSGKTFKVPEKISNLWS